MRNIREYRGILFDDNEILNVLGFKYRFSLCDNSVEIINVYINNIFFRKDYCFSIEYINNRKYYHDIEIYNDFLDEYIQYNRNNLLNLLKYN